MIQLKVFYAKCLTSDLQREDTINLMNEEINVCMLDWAKKEKITSYKMINSQLTATPEIDLFGQRYASAVILSAHVEYEKQ